MTTNGYPPGGYPPNPYGQPQQQPYQYPAQPAYPTQPPPAQSYGQPAYPPQPPPGYPPQGYPAQPAYAPQAAPPGPPPAPAYAPQAAGANVSPELLAQLARQRATVDARTERSYSDRREIEWWKPNTPKPEEIGQTNESLILVLPRSADHVGALPWTLTAQHQVMQRGESTSVVCPIDDHKLNEADNPASGPPGPCPICAAAEVMFKRMYEFPKESKEGEYWKNKGRDLRARMRGFVNVLDLGNVQSHWKVDQEKGTAGAEPKLWGFGQGVLDKFLSMAAEIGAFWHPSTATVLKVLTTRTGREAINVKYDVMPSMSQPIGGARIPAGYEGALSTLIDASVYRKQRTASDMAALLPSWAREDAQSAPAPTVSSPYAVQGPPPGAPAPAYPMPAPAAAAPPAYQPPPMPSAPPTYAQPPPAYAPQAAPPGPPPAPAYSAPWEPQAAPPMTAVPPAMPSLPPMPGAPPVPSQAAPPPGMPPPGFAPASAPPSMPSMPNAPASVAPSPAPGLPALPPLPPAPPRPT